MRWRRAERERLCRLRRDLPADARTVAEQLLQRRLDDLTAAWNDVAPFDRKTARLIGEMMNTLYDSVANDESFRPREFEAALRKIRTGLLR